MPAVDAAAKAPPPSISPATTQTQTQTQPQTSQESSSPDPEMRDLAAQAASIGLARQGKPPVLVDKGEVKAIGGEQADEGETELATAAVTTGAAQAAAPAAAPAPTSVSEAGDVKETAHEKESSRALSGNEDEQRINTDTGVDTTATITTTTNAVSTAPSALDAPPRPETMSSAPAEKAQSIEAAQAAKTELGDGEAVRKTDPLSSADETARRDDAIKEVAQDRGVQRGDDIGEGATAGTEEVSEADEEALGAEIKAVEAEETIAEDVKGEGEGERDLGAGRVRDGRGDGRDEVEKTEGGDEVAELKDKVESVGGQQSAGPAGGEKTQEQEATDQDQAGVSVED